MENKTNKGKLENICNFVGKNVSSSMDYALNTIMYGATLSVTGLSGYALGLELMRNDVHWNLADKNAAFMIAGVVGFAYWHKVSKEYFAERKRKREQKYMEIKNVSGSNIGKGYNDSSLK